jgi:hypothetical protein
MMLKDNGALLAVGAVAAVAVAAGVRSGSFAASRSSIATQTGHDVKLRMPTPTVVEGGRVHATATTPSDQQFFGALGLKASADGLKYHGRLTPFIASAIRARDRGEMFHVIPADGEPNMEAGLAEAASRLGLPGGALSGRGVTPSIAARVARVPPDAPVGVLDGRAHVNGALFDALRKRSDLAGAMEHRLLEQVHAWAKGYDAQSIILIGDASTDRDSWVRLGFAPLLEHDGVLLAIAKVPAR